MEMSIREFMMRYDNGEFDAPDRETQCEAGWGDWFCKDSSLSMRLERLAGKLRRVLAADNGKRINQDTMCVWFKNNSPTCGKLYDDFRIADINSGDVVFTIVPASGHRSNFGEAEVWGHGGDGVFVKLVSGEWHNVIEFFRGESAIAAGTLWEPETVGHSPCHSLLVSWLHERTISKLAERYANRND